MKSGGGSVQRLPGLAEKQSWVSRCVVLGHESTSVPQVQDPIEPASMAESHEDYP